MIFDEITLENCGVTPDLETITETDEVTIILTANENYEFVTRPYIIIWGVGQSQLFFDIIENGAKATLNVNFDDYNINVVDLYAVAEPKTAYKDFGAINVYKVGFTELNNFALKRYLTQSQTIDDQKIINKIDLGDYIISLKRFYNDLGQTTANVIHAANYDTEINAQTPLNDIIEINFGNLNIPEFNENDIDYLYDINIFLPFIGLQSLNKDLAGKTIKLKYEINILSGKGSAKIFLVETEIIENKEVTNEILLNIFDCEPYDEVIFKPPTNAYNNTTLNFRSSYGFEPYIIIKYFDSNEISIKNDNKRGVINSLNLSGLCKLTDVVFDYTNFATSMYIKPKENEEEEIKRILADGIIF